MSSAPGSCVTRDPQHARALPDDQDHAHDHRREPEPDAQREHRRHRLDHDPDAQIGRAPDHVHDEQGAPDLPRGRGEERRPGASADAAAWCGWPRRPAIRTASRRGRLRIRRRPGRGRSRAQGIGMCATPFVRLDPVSRRRPPETTPRSRSRVPRPRSVHASVPVRMPVEPACPAIYGSRRKRTTPTDLSELIPTLHGWVSNELREPDPLGRGPALSFPARPFERRHRRSGSGRWRWLSSIAWVVRVAPSMG